MDGMLSFADVKTSHLESPKKSDWIDDLLLPLRGLIIHETYYVIFCGKALQNMT